MTPYTPFISTLTGVRVPPSPAAQHLPSPARSHCRCVSARCSSVRASCPQRHVPPPYPPPPPPLLQVREREMLIGARILPPEFFAAAKNPFVIGLGARE